MLKFEHDSEAFWSFFWTWFGFLCAQVSSGYFETKSREKFSILSLKPRSHVRILIYRTWAKRLVLEAEHWPSGCPHVPFSVTCSITCPHTLYDNWQWANFVFSYILGDPGAVSRAGRKGATKVFKHRRKSPWVPTLTGPFPNGQAIAGSWLGTKCFVLLCPIGEQHPLSSFREFVHDGHWLDHGLSGSWVSTTW